VFKKSGSKTINVAYIKKALAKSQLIFKPKRLLSRDWFLYRDNFAVCTTTSVQDFKLQQRQKDNPPAPLFCQIFPQQVVSLSEVKTELAGISLSQKNIKMSWDGAVQTITENEFTAAFRW
jgi:hypothetical protein